MILQVFNSVILKIKARKNKTKIYARVVPKDLQVGKFCTIGKKTHISEGVCIGDFSYVNGNFMDTFIESHTQIGKYCSIGPGVMIGMGNHYISFCSTHPILFDKYYKNRLQWDDVVLKYNGLCDKELATVIGSDVWIGARANIKRGIRIGNGAVIAADAVVTKDVPDYAIVAGCPARVVKYRFEKEDVDFLRENEKYCFWNWSREMLRKNLSAMYEIKEYKMVIDELRK